MMAATRRTVGRVALALILLALLWTGYRLIGRLARVAPGSALDQFLLRLLAVAVLVLAIGFAGLIIRNLVRLILERRRGIFGARLQTKLVFFLMALVLVPALVLFYGSASVIRLTVEAVVRTPVNDLTRSSERIVDDWTDFLQAEALRRAGEIAAKMKGADRPGVGREAVARRLVRRALRDEVLDAVYVRSGNRALAFGASPSPTGPGGAATAPLLADLSSQATSTGAPARRIDRIGQGLLIEAATPVDTGRSPRWIVVAAAIYLPPGRVAPMEAITAAAETYQRFRAQRRDLVRFYLYVMGLLFLATLFVALWIGLYVSRRITGPLQEIAGAAREISEGNLGVRVQARVGDEVGRLVDAFNEMTAQLQESREVITRAAADLRRSNRALDERRRYIETLVANLSTAVISLDRAGRVTTANPAAERILGFPLRVGEDVRVRLRERIPGPLAELLDPAVIRDKGIRQELQITRGGETLSVAVQVSRLPGAPGEVPGILLMIEDLTDLLRAQRAAAWREVARRIAHEIKNPLTPIQLAAQRLRKKFNEDASDLEQLLPEATASIEREVTTLKNLVNEFSRFARMPEVSPRPSDFARVVEEAVSLYRGLPDLTVEVDPDRSLGQVNVDPEQMRRALVNLVDNSVAAMGGKGTVGVRYRRADNSRLLLIEVFDDGPGIAPEDRARMFVPYFSTKERGTGLGLAIVHRIVTDHGGTVRVEDNRPRGVRVVIEIPVIPAREAADNHGG